MICAPLADGLLDGFRLEALGEGAMDEICKFVVGGEAQGHELGDGEFIDVCEIGGCKDPCESEAFFEPDEAILDLKVIDAALCCENSERKRDDDGPVSEVRILVTEVDGNVDGYSDVDEEDREHEEVHQRIEADMVLVVLLNGHQKVLSFSLAVSGTSIAFSNTR
jgi:hypothetical protein